MSAPHPAIVACPSCRRAIDLRDERPGAVADVREFGCWRCWLGEPPPRVPGPTRAWVAS